MITITEHEKAYMIAKAKHEARIALLIELEETYRNKSYMIDRLMYSQEASNIFDHAHGERLEEIYEKRTILRAKAMESWNAGSKLFKKILEENETWRESQNTEGLF